MSSRYSCGLGYHHIANFIPFPYGSINVQRNTNGAEKFSKFLELFKKAFKDQKQKDLIKAVATCDACNDEARKHIEKFEENEISWLLGRGNTENSEYRAWEACKYLYKFKSYEDWLKKNYLDFADKNSDMDSKNKVEDFWQKRSKKMAQALHKKLNGDASER